MAPIARADSQESDYRVHDSGDRTLDGIFRLIGFGEREEPLEEVLTAMCGDVASIARADIASIYVREGEGESERGRKPAAIPEARPHGTTSILMTSKRPDDRTGLRNPWGGRTCTSGPWPPIRTRT